MLDSAVKITRVYTTSGVDPKTLLPSDHIVTEFSVGTHGPFTISTPKENFTHDYLAEETGKIVHTLRTSGAIV